MTHNQATDWTYVVSRQIDGNYSVDHFVTRHIAAYANTKAEADAIKHALDAAVASGKLPRTSPSSHDVEAILTVAAKARGED